MTKEISVGDLAQVTRAHCADDQWLGHTFVVTGFKSGTGWCYACRQKIGDGNFPLDEDGRPWFYAKRIPPLDELEGEKDFAKLVDDMQRKLKEPA